MTQGDHAAGNIYDLGYRHYEGARLGRGYGVLSLFLYSLRAAFGFGRHAGTKVVPIALFVILMLPPSIQLGIAAIIPRDVEVIKAENYFGFVQLILGLFCAAVAPELVGRDQRNHTLALYFSRPLLRSDYAFAKVAALVAALFIVTMIPQTVLYIGTAFANDDAWGYIQENWHRVAPITLSALAISVFMASISLAIAAQTSRRAFATGGVLAFFVILAAVGNVLFNSTSGDLQRAFVLIDPFTVIEGMTFWIFRATPEADSFVARADLPGILYFGVALAAAAISTGIVFRRFQRIAA